MKVKWEQFAQRRKINLEMFGSMSDEDYASWCNFRKVEPVSKESYDGVKRLLASHETKEKEQESIQKEDDVSVVTISTHEFDEGQLKKMNKRALIKICKEFNMSIEKSETKNRLIEKLLSLNNS